jgi:hypothetical protein
MEYQKSIIDKEYLLNPMEERDKSCPYQLLHSPDKTDTFLARMDHAAVSIAVYLC